MRILVVEDSPTAALHIRRKLEEMGHKVIEAKNGREAWEYLQRQHETMVITDWMMPEMNGPELCRLIRTQTTKPYTYIILMTVKDLRKDCLEGLLAGADDFLTKPADSIELVASLGSAKRILACMEDLRKRITTLEATVAELSPKDAHPAEIPVLAEDIWSH
jgi:two-component system, cell cycle response regulator